MAGMGGDRKNPGPKNAEFTKQKNLQRPRGSVAKSTGQRAGADEQFNKKKSYDGDDGSSVSAAGGPKAGADKQFTGKSGSSGDAGKRVSGVGSSGMGDEQFISHLQDNQASYNGKLGSKSSGGKPGSFDGQKLSPAAAIMREVARAAQGPGPDQSYQGSKKVSSPKSKSQTKSFKDTTTDSGQGRPKATTTQPVKEKKSQGQLGPYGGSKPVKRGGASGSGGTQY